MKALTLLATGFAILSLLSLSGCAGGVTETGNPSRSYVTSGTDSYGTWEVTDSSFTADWNVTSSTGVVQYTYQLVGGCGAPTTFGFRPCALIAVQCQPGASGCSGVPVAGEIFYLLEIPGVSFMAYVPTKNIVMSGVLKGDCSSPVAGDYTIMPTGGVLPTYFSVSRVDAALTTSIGASFSMTTPASPQLFYATTASSGTGTSTINGLSCVDGIREYITDGVPIRATITTGGLWTFSFPAGLGGALAFKTSLAAQTADLADKTFYGFVAGTTGTVAMARLETDSLSGTHVPFKKVVVSTVGEIPLIGQYYVSAKDAGSLYGLNGNPPGGSGTSYANNLLQPSYPTPGDIPGLFVQPVGATVSDGGFVTAMKSNGKVILIGISFGNVSGSVLPTSTAILFEQ